MTVGNERQLEGGAVSPSNFRGLTLGDSDSDEYDTSNAAVSFLLLGPAMRSLGI